jgi:hypothetical protein
MKEHLKQFAFKPGQSGNPEGRPPTGRQLALACLERWLLAHGEEYMEALGKEALAKPIQFGRDILIPLFPKEMLITSRDGDGKTAIWHCLTEMAARASNGDATEQTAIEADCKEVPDAGNP